MSPDPARAPSFETLAVALCALLLGAMTLSACDDGSSAAEPADAMADAIGPDAADAMPDAMPDALGDAMPDAMPDALPIPSDAMPDAMPDAASGPDLGFDPDNAPIFAAGCPGPGRAIARQLQDPGARLEGPDALGGPGDWLLANARAAFVITGDGPHRTYFYYPGIPVDAVRIEGCRQTTPDRFEEIGWLVGNARLDRFSTSTVRAFHGIDWQIIRDGSDGGEARLRVTGVDDTQWLVENELLRVAWREGEPRAPSVAQGVELFIDYVLDPDSVVLRMEYGIRNLNPEAIGMATLAMAQFGDSAPVSFFEDQRFDIQGFSVRRGLPFIGSRSDDGAWGVAMAGRSTSNANISGVEALFDFVELAAAPFVSAAGGAGDTRVTTWLLAVESDLERLAVALDAANPRALRGAAQPLGAIDGQVIDPAGAGVESTVSVQLRSRDGQWSTYTELRTDADGRFSGWVPDLGDGARVRVAPPERAPVTLEVMLDAEPATVQVGPTGGIVYDIIDGAERPIPAHVELWRGNRRVDRFATRAVEGQHAIPPGDYQIVITRGFEYTRHVEDISVPPDGSARVDARLERIIDTTGWLTTDGHAHAGPSSDSDVDIADRVTFAAAAGLEVAIGTDHEIVSDWQPGIDRAGLGAYIATVGGQEVTATLPEHINAWPIPAHPDAARGDPVVWYGMDIAGVFDAIHQRGAPIAQLNHPRGGCNYMCLIDYDRITGAPRLDDPTVLGMAADAALWSWDFEAIELMNGLGSPFLDPRSPQTTGLFEDWQSFLNHGHRVTAMGVSDVHGLDQGNPMTYFAAPTDDPAAFTADMLADAILGGRAQISAGAFIEASIAGAGPGSDVVPEGPLTLDIRVQALPEIDVQTVVVYANCDQIAAFDAISGVISDGIVKLDAALPLDLPADAHLTVAAFGGDGMPRGLIGYNPGATPRAITNAIYVDLAGDGFDPPGGKACEYTVPAR